MSRPRTEDGDTFSYQPAGENTHGITSISFTVGSGGTAASADIGNFTGDSPLTQNLGAFFRASLAGGQ